MYRHSFVLRTLLAGATLITVGLLASPSFAAEKAKPQPAGPVASSGQASHAAGSVEDSLQACLARIPKDATAGQRMVAEQSCQRDEGDRKPFQANR